MFIKGKADNQIGNRPRTQSEMGQDDARFCAICQSPRWNNIPGAVETNRAARPYRGPLRHTPVI